MYKVSVTLSSSEEPQVFPFEKREDAVKYFNEFRSLKVPKVEVIRLEDNRVIYKSERMVQTSE